MDVGDWLRGLGLPQYANSFAENGIDAEVLQQLTADDLKELGVAALGHRRKLLTAIAVLRQPGASAPHTSEPLALPEPQAASAPQRRHLTVLFCDLVGSTALSARLDPEDLREVIRRYHAVVAETVHSQGGFVAQYLGDGALVYFGFPAAHEDDAERAVRAALLVRDAAQSIEVKGKSLQVRAGLATGLVVVGDRPEGSAAAHEPQVTGETPNRAARLQSLAHPGGIVIDAATRRLVGRMFDLRELAAASLKGFEAPVECWQVLGEAAIESRFEALRSGETPLIGRDEELDLLTKRWHQVKAGSGRVVLISGEAGLGKSRLVSALEERIRTDRSDELRYFCSPQHTSTALYPITTNLTRAAKFADGDTPDQKLEKLRSLVAGQEHLAFIADLFSLPVRIHAELKELAPEERRQKVFAALLARIEALAKNGPLFILFEDAHWIDPTTQELIDLLISRIGDLPILLILTFRSEFQAPWTGQPNVTTLALTRLRSDDCAALIRLLTADSQLPSEVVDEIAERTDGVPLFAEELSKALMDANKGAVRKNVSGAELHVPESLHASLLARLDHVGAQAREIAQAGSVIGREFSYPLLTRMAADCGILHRKAIENALEALVGSGLVFARGAPPDGVYTFKHALVQDAAYSTLLRTQRQKLHAALASLMEGEANVAPEVLAYHFIGAGELDRAAEQWFKAGQAANERSAHLETIRSFQNALDIISSLPSTREREFQALEITGAMCSPMIAAKWLMSETTEIINKAAQMAGSLGVSPPAAVLYHQALHHIGSSDHRQALRLLKLFREAAGVELQTRAETSISTAVYMSGGSLEEALEHISTALAGYDRKLHSKQRFQFTYEPRCVALSTESLELTLRGYFDQAKAAEREALAYAAEFDHPQTTGHLLAYKLLRGEFQEDYSELEETARALSHHAHEHKIVFWSLWTDIFTGFAAARSGRPQEGIATIDKSLKVFADMKFTYFRPYHLGLKARAYEIAGDLENALSSIAEGIALAKDSGERAVLADLIRLSGALRLALSGGAAIESAEELFREAMTLAQAQASKLHELRAATSLARLWLSRGRDAEARDLLQPVYEWFTEGLDAPDLLRAAAVLADASANPQHENAA
jgi:class 3 adenylate cyclase/predicted ATPase